MSITQIPEQLAKMGDMLREVLAAVKGSPVLAQELAEAKAQASVATENLKLANAEIETLKANANDFTAKYEAKISELTGTITAKESELKTATEAKDSAEAKAKDLVDNPSKVALEIAAKAGVKPADRPTGDAKTEIAKPKGLSAVQAAIAEEIKGKK